MATMAKDMRRVADGNIAKQNEWVRHLILIIGVLLVAFVAERLYQQFFAWSKGMDSTLPEYQTYWMSLFFFNIISVGLVTLAWCGYLLWTEPRKTVALPAAEELRRIKTLWVYLAGTCFVIFWAASYYAEQDGSWHQVTIRDTAFTPSHVVIFYFSFPLIFTFAMASYLYGRTRLPHLFRDRGFPLSFGLVIGSGVLLMFQLALNEWSHSFWIAEELFSAPFHWGFVIFAYLAAGIFAVWFQTAGRIAELQKTLTGQTASKGA